MRTAHQTSLRAPVPSRTARATAGPALAGPRRLSQPDNDCPVTSGEHPPRLLRSSGRFPGSRPPRCLPPAVASASLPGADRGSGRGDREAGGGETGCAQPPPTI